MATIEIKDVKGAAAGTVDVNDAVFGIEPNMPVMHRTVKAQQASWRQGTANTRTRGIVRGGGKKPWRQKGTGNARQGSIRAPQWIKGGVVFAPKPRDFSKDMNKKAKGAALLSALSKKVADGELVVIDSLEVKEGKTKEMVAFQKALGLEKSAIIYMDNDDVNVIRAAQNIQKLSTLPVTQISTYEIVANAKVVMTKAAVKKIEEVYA